MFTNISALIGFLFFHTCLPLYAQIEDSKSSRLSLEDPYIAIKPPKKGTAACCSLQELIPISNVEVGLGMIYSKFQGSLPTAKDQFRGHIKEQEALHSQVGIEFGPFNFYRTTAAGAYQYSQEWYTDNDSLTDYIRRPFSAFGQLLKNADLLEREHRVFLNSKTSLHPNISFLLWITKKIRLAGSSYIIKNNDDFHTNKAYLLNDWAEIKPQFLWSINYAYSLKIYFDFFKKYYNLQPEQSYQSYYFSTKVPRVSYGLVYQYKPLPYNYVEIDLFREDQRLNDPLEDFKRIGFTFSGISRINKRISIHASIGILKDLYLQKSIFFSEHQNALATRTRHETINFFGFTPRYQLDNNNQINVSIFLSRNHNPNIPSKTLKHLEGRLNWTYSVPNYKKSLLNTTKLAKRSIPKRIEYHGIR